MGQPVPQPYLETLDRFLGHPVADLDVLGDRLQIEERSESQMRRYVPPNLCDGDHHRVFSTSMFFPEYRGTVTAGPEGTVGMHVFSMCSFDRETRMVFVYDDELVTPGLYPRAH